MKWTEESWDDEYINSLFADIYGFGTLSPKDPNYIKWLAGWFAGALLPRLGALALCAGGMSAVYLVAAWPLGLGEEVRAALAKKH